MPGSQINTEKAAKTASLVVGGNVCLLWLYALDHRLGVTANLAFTSVAFYMLHHVGKERRPGSNFIARCNGVFAPYTGDPSVVVDNATRNIVNGGDAVYEEVMRLIKP